MSHGVPERSLRETVVYMYYKQSPVLKIKGDNYRKRLEGQISI